MVNSSPHNGRQVFGPSDDHQGVGRHLHQQTPIHPRYGRGSSDRLGNDQDPADDDRGRLLRSARLSSRFYGRFKITAVVQPGQRVRALIACSRLSRRRRLAAGRQLFGHRGGNSRRFSQSLCLAAASTQVAVHRRSCLGQSSGCTDAFPESRKWLHTHIWLAPAPRTVRLAPAYCPAVRGPL